MIDAHAASAMTASLEARLTGDYRQDLLTMGSYLLQLLVERGDSLRLMLCEAAHFPEVGEVMAQNPRQLRKMLARYLQEQMEQGRVRQLHAKAAAQAFWGMFFGCGISLGLLSEAVSPEMSTQDLAAQSVDLFVDGTIERTQRAE